MDVLDDDPSKLILHDITLPSSSPRTDITKEEFGSFLEELDPVTHSSYAYNHDEPTKDRQFGGNTFTPFQSHETGASMSLFEEVAGVKRSEQSFNTMSNVAQQGDYMPAVHSQAADTSRSTDLDRTMSWNSLPEQPHPDLHDLSYPSLTITTEAALRSSLMGDHARPYTVSQYPHTAEASVAYQGQANTLEASANPRQSHTGRTYSRSFSKTFIYDNNNTRPRYIYNHYAFDRGTNPSCNSDSKDFTNRQMEASDVAAKKQHSSRHTTQNTGAMERCNSVDSGIGVSPLDHKPSYCRNDPVWQQRGSGPVFDSPYQDYQRLKPTAMGPPQRAMMNRNRSNQGNVIHHYPSFPPQRQELIGQPQVQFTPQNQCDLAAPISAKSRHHQSYKLRNEAPESRALSPHSALIRDYQDPSSAVSGDPPPNINIMEMKQCKQLPSIPHSSDYPAKSWECKEKFSARPACMKTKHSSYGPGNQDPWQRACQSFKQSAQSMEQQIDPFGQHTQAMDVEQQFLEPLSLEPEFKKPQEPQRSDPCSSQLHAVPKLSTKPLKSAQPLSVQVKSLRKVIRTLQECYSEHVHTLHLQSCYDVKSREIEQIRHAYLMKLPPILPMLDAINKHFDEEHTKLLDWCFTQATLIVGLMRIEPMNDG